MFFIVSFNSSRKPLSPVNMLLVKHDESCKVELEHNSIKYEWKGVDEKMFCYWFWLSLHLPGCCMQGALNSGLMDWNSTCV